MNRAMMTALVAILTLLPSSGWSGPPLQPHHPGWTRVFRVDWEIGDRSGQPTVQGYLQNASPYTLDRIQLLVDALDNTGAVVGQKAFWLLGSPLAPFSRRYFEAIVPQEAPQYRVQVYSYDSIEAPGGGGGGSSKR